MTVPLSSRPSLVFRPATARFHTQLDWLESWHTFSFASHRDPAWMGFGPLRVINDDTIAPGRGFGLHPHRDMEIITVIVEGELHHHDSMGHSAVLQAGEVQRMSAGTGIVHSEINGGGSPCRLLQIWIEPSQSGVPPAYEQKAFPKDQGWTLLLHPEAADGAMAMVNAVRMWRATPTSGQTLSLACAQGQPSWIQMIAGDGQLRLGDGTDALPLRQGDGVGFVGPPSSAAAEAFTAGADGADVLLFALPNQP